MRRWRGALLLLAAAASLVVWVSLTATPGPGRAATATAEPNQIAHASEELDHAPPTARVAQSNAASASDLPADRDPSDADAGELPSPEHLVALGAVVSGTPPSELPPVEQRLAQAREAIVAFSDRIDTLEQRLRDAQQQGADTREIERKLVAAQHQLEVARFAERANEAEAEGHPL